MEDIVASLERELENPKHEKMARICLERLRQAPPLSLKVTLELLKRGKIWDYGTCMKEEYKALWNLMKSPNFEVAMRHRNTKSPDKWSLFVPARLEDVSPEMVDKHMQAAKDMLTQNPGELNAADPLDFGVPTKSLLPHRLHYQEYEDPIRLWFNENKISFEYYVRENFYIQLRGQLMNRGIDYREGTVNAATVREAFYRKDLLERLFDKEMHELQMLTTDEIYEQKYGDIVEEISRRFEMEIDEEGRLRPLEPT